MPSSSRESGSGVANRRWPRAKTPSSRTSRIAISSSPLRQSSNWMAEIFRITSYSDASKERLQESPRNATVYRNRLTGDIGGAWRRQKHDHVRDLAGFTETAERNF